MNNMKILFERHGESELNKQNIFTGSIDADLSDVGVKQGKLAADYITNNYKIDKIYSSPLIRAYHTAQFVAEKINLDIIVKDSLVEYNGGDWEGKNLDELKTKYKEEYETWKNDISKIHIKNGQKMSDFYDLKVKAFDEIMKENDGFDGTILIVGHVLALKCMICHIVKNDIKYLKDIGYFSNASMFEFDYDPKTGTFINNKWGYADYLNGLITSVYSDWRNDKKG